MAFIVIHKPNIVKTDVSLT